MTIYTIGYEAATMADFLDTLARAGVRRVIDVRALPLSRRPGFSKSSLAASLGEVGIDYVHLKALGTPKRGRDAAKKGDVATLTAVYDEQLELPEAQAAAARMLELAAEMPSALLCYERDPCHCHRTLLLEAVERGKRWSICMSDPAIARLTENEKECLRRRLRPQTAKEMAIDLGISPHAVEKRLKMARTKLGLSSSLAAARLLAEAEGYQTLVPRPSDLLVGAPGVEEEVAVASPIGVEARPIHKGSIMLAALFLIALVQDVPTPEAYRSVMKNEKGEDVSSRKVGMDEAAAWNRMGFRQKDVDHSGFLNPREASAMEPRDRYRDASLPPAPAAGSRDPAGERIWMAKLDNNRDGRVSEEEYVGYMMPWTLLSGVPADWQPGKE